MGKSRRRSDGKDDSAGVRTPTEIEADLVEREARTSAYEATRADRKTRQDGILADAEVRDDVADARDDAAERRDEAASLDAFLKDDGYADRLPARRQAAQDRLSSKTDRESAADDRDQLTDDEREAPASERD